MDINLRYLVQKQWLLTVLSLIALFIKGVEAHHVGFSLRKDGPQNATSALKTDIGPWSTKSSNSRGLYLLSMTFDDNNLAPIIPRSGIYYFILKIYLENTKSQSRYGLRLKSSFSDRTLSAWTSNCISSCELTLSGNIKLSVSEKVFVTLHVEASNVQISDESWFAMHLLGQFGLLPSFLARPMIDERLIPKRDIQLFNWKTYQESTTSFSGAEGIFVPIVDGKYLCNLNLVIEDVYGIVRVALKAGNETLFTFSKQFMQRKPIASLHVSKIFNLRKHAIFRPILNIMNASVIISKTTTFSCTMIDHQQRSIDLFINSSSGVEMDNRKQWEINLWEERESSNDFRLIKEDGKVFFLSEESLVLVSLSITFESLMNSTVSVAFTLGGVNREDGIFKSELHSKSNVLETIALTGYIKIKERESGYISAFMETEQGNILKIKGGKLRVIAIEQPLSVLTVPFMDSKYSLASLQFSLENGWRVLKIDKNIYTQPFRTCSVHWNIGQYSFSPKEKGIYYLSINMQTKIENISLGETDVLEAKIVVSGKADGRTTVLQYNIRSVNDGTITLNLAGVFLLKSRERIYIIYKCRNCEILETSGFSAVWLFNHFKVEGFSTKIAENENISLKNNIGQWSRYFSNFEKTSSFAFDEGIYIAPYECIYLISCSITIENAPVDTSLKLRLNIANKTTSYTEYFHKASQEKRVSSLVFSMPLWLTQGQSVSLLLETDEILGTVENLILRNGSSFSIVAMVGTQSSEAPGFTLSLQNNLKYSSGMPSRPLRGWTDTKLEGAFFREANDLYQFNRRQGEISIRNSAVLLLNIIVNVKIKERKQLVLYVMMAEKDVKRVLTSKQLYDSKGESNEPLKISLVLHVKSKDTIRVELRQAKKGRTYDVSENTIMSAVYLSNVPTKPGLMVGVRGYSVSQDQGKATFKFKLKNICTGCYQDSIEYEENGGYFKIPFAGRYLISFNLNYKLASSSPTSSQCGIYSIKDEKFLALKGIADDGRFEIAEILNFNKSDAVAFTCYLTDEMELADNNFISMTLLQYSVPYSNSILKRNVLVKGIHNELATSIVKPAQYLVAVKGLNNTVSNFKLLTKSKRKQDVILARIGGNHLNDFDTLYSIVLLNETSHLSLQWYGEPVNADRNRTSLYEVDPSSYTITLQLKNDFVIKPSNRTSRLIRNWRKSHSFGNELDFDYKRSLFIAKQPGEYLVVVNGRTIAKQNQKRLLYVAIGDEQEKDSFSVPLCQVDGKSCGTSFIHTFKLQKWHSIGLYIRLVDENDTLTVLEGTRFSIVLLEANVPKHEDPGPRFTSQPKPVYKNTSTIFDWECDAAGSNDIIYKWNWISRETKAKTVAAYGNILRIDGKPEESGYYFCTAEMNGNLHNSRIATLDISDTNECKLNQTEVGQLCHKNAHCINTIGSYVCRCNIGFKGNGFSHCEDIDECKSGEPCHANATCNNTQGSYICKCKPGFNGNGTYCNDTDECKGSNDCDKNSICINEVGYYRCVCATGFTGNGLKCSNINECNNEIYPCHKKASCSDTDGSFKCKCKEGWTGNGTICTDINECLYINCTGNATCHNEPGRYRCICNRGYKGDGAKYCEPLGCTPPSRCIGEYKAAWWTRSPYLANGSNNQPIGLFKDLLTQVMVDCCDNCSQLSFDSAQNGSLEVEAIIEGNKTVDFGCPLYGSPDQTLFRGFPFMPIVESPGIAFFIKDQPKEKSALMESLGSTWPILAITFLLACLSGVVIWFLDTVRNPTEFPNSFIKGSWEGFWWAFITMTTVGYGDKAPRSFPARVFGIVWILVGLVIISTFTATITTMLTASSLSDETKLYGTKVGVLHNSEEYRLGVKRNAETKAYGSVAEIVSKIKEGEVQGILLDTYIAGEYQDQLKDLRLQQVIDYTFSYGVVLSRDALSLRKCFSRFLESKQSQIYSTISKVIKPLKTNGQQNFAAQKSANIFDAHSVYFKYIIFIGLGTFAVLFLIGLIWECYITRQKRKQYVLASSSDAKELEVTQWRVQWESGKVSQFSSNIFKSDISDLKQQIKDFAETWVSRLEELEKKQEQEINELKNEENKKNKRRTDSKFGQLFKYFSGSGKTDTNGVGHKVTTAL